MPLLIVERGGNKGASVRVEAGKAFVVGRENPQSSLPLQDPLASRNHFEIRSGDGGTWLIRDLKSRNGTSLNDERLDPATPVPLKIGDKIQVGDTIFSFLSDEKEESTGGLVGKVIGGYRLMERLGRGGMGTVYKAEQLSLHRVVALKVLSPKLMADPTFVEKFISEARAAGQLNHPNIVQVFDVGSDRGVHFFSMELMAPESVGDVVSKQGPLPWDRALDMMMDAARGLIYAEKKGIVHRDIKPDNLMLTPEGTVKIGDLGLAKQGDEAGSAGTEGGAIFGTPHFIAPEQAQGKAVDNRADIYSLGATFYRILTGKTPFTGENVKEILLKQINEEPPSLQKAVPDLPPEMALVVGKMMKKRADDRYRSAQGLIEDLESIRIKYHVETHGAAQAARRNKILAGVLGVAVLALGGVAWHFINKPPVERIIDNTKPTEDIVPVERTPEEIAAEREGKANTAFLEVQLKALEFEKRSGGPDPFATATWKSLSKDWVALAERYEAMAAAHSGTDKAKDATKKAKYIRDRMAEAAADDAARREAASTAAAEALAAIAAARAEGDLQGALHLIVSAPATLAGTHKGYLPDSLESDLAGARREIVEQATSAVDAATAAVIAALSQFPPVGLEEARTALLDALTTIDPREGSPDDPDLTNLRKSASATVEAAAAKAREAAVAALDADNAAYVDAYAKIRAWAAEGTSPETAATPYFDFRWDESIAAWTTLCDSMRTALFRARCNEKIAQYERCKQLFLHVAKRLESGDFRDPGFPESVRKGAGLFLDRSPGYKPPTTEGVAIIRTIGGSRTKGWFEFRELTPAEFYVDFLKRGAPELALDAEGNLNLATFLAEAGEGQLAVEQFGPATLAMPDLKSRHPALVTWLEQEINAFSDYTAVLQRWEGYTKTRSEGAKPDVLESLRAQIDAAARAFGEREATRSSDYYLLHHHAGPGEAPHVAYPASWKEQVLAPYGTLGAHAGGINGGGTKPGDGGSGNGKKNGIKEDVTEPGKPDGEDGKESGEAPADDDAGQRGTEEQR